MDVEELLKGVKCIGKPTLLSCEQVSQGNSSDTTLQMNMIHLWAIYVLCNRDKLVTGLQRS